MKQGQAKAQEGDLKEAEAKFKQAQKLDSSVVIPTETKVKQLAANALVKKEKISSITVKSKKPLPHIQKHKNWLPIWKLLLILGIISVGQVVYMVMLLR